MAELRTAHTGELDADTMAAIRRRAGSAGGGRSSVLSPAGIRHTARSDGHIYVLPVSGPLDLSGELTCDWRHGSPW